MVFLANIAEPPRASRAYLNAAREAAFNYLITNDLNTKDQSGLTIVTIDDALQMQAETNAIWDECDLFFCKANADVDCWI